MRTCISEGNKPWTFNNTRSEGRLCSTPWPRHVVQSWCAMAGGGGGGEARHHSRWGHCVSLKERQSSGRRGEGPGLKPWLLTYLLCVLGQVTHPLWASYKTRVERDGEVEGYLSQGVSGILSVLYAVPGWVPSIHKMATIVIITFIWWLSKGSWRQMPWSLPTPQTWKGLARAEGRALALRWVGAGSQRSGLPDLTPHPEGVAACWEAQGRLYIMKRHQ